jgi:RNase P subunit RPR2
MFNCRIRSKDMEKCHLLINQGGKNTMVIAGKFMQQMKNSSNKSTICILKVNKRSINDQCRKFAVFLMPFVSNL